MLIHAASSLSCFSTVHNIICHHNSLSSYNLHIYTVHIAYMYITQMQDTQSPNRLLSVLSHELKEIVVGRGERLQRSSSTLRNSHEDCRGTE